MIQNVHYRTVTVEYRESWWKREIPTNLGYNRVNRKAVEICLELNKQPIQFRGKLLVGPREGGCP